GFSWIFGGAFFLPTRASRISRMVRRTSRGCLPGADGGRDGAPGIVVGVSEAGASTVSGEVAGASVGADAGDAPAGSFVVVMDACRMVRLGGFERLERHRCEGTARITDFDHSRMGVALSTILYHPTAEFDNVGSKKRVVSQFAGTVNSIRRLVRVV